MDPNVISKQCYFMLLVFFPIRTRQDCRHAHGEDELQPLTAQKPAQQALPRFL